LKAALDWSKSFLKAKRLLFSSQRAASIEHVLEKLLRCFGFGIFKVFEFERPLSDKEINVIGKRR
jgi:hypothetical protein